MRQMFFSLTKYGRFVALNVCMWGQAKPGRSCPPNPSERTCPSRGRGPRHARERPAASGVVGVVFVGVARFLIFFLFLVRGHARVASARAPGPRGIPAARHGERGEATPNGRYRGKRGGGIQAASRAKSAAASSREASRRGAAMGSYLVGLLGSGFVGSPPTDRRGRRQSGRDRRNLWPRSHESRPGLRLRRCAARPPAERIAGWPTASRNACPRARWTPSKRAARAEVRPERREVVGLFALQVTGITGPR